MADEPQSSPDGASGGANGAEGQSQFQIIAQYVKDLSFENPGAPGTISGGRPQVGLKVDIQARRAADEQYEVTLKLRVEATQEDRTAFLLELVYGGLFLLRNIPEESLQPALLIECPRMIFPFARRIVADAIRDGGMPPLMIEPIDFVALYRARIAEQQAGAQAPARQ